jgi:plasmid stabilization system protein ParE
MSLRVVLTARAERDRDTAFEWYCSNYSREFASRWYSALSETLQFLRE